jgi:hypothetical protein
MEIKLAIQHYFLIASKCDDNIHIKIINTNNFIVYEQHLYLCDILELKHADTLNKFYKILTNAFQTMNEKNINILNPNLQDDEYCVLLKNN